MTPPWLTDDAPMKPSVDASPLTIRNRSAFGLVWSARGGILLEEFGARYWRVVDCLRSFGIAYA